MRRLAALIVIVATLGVIGMTIPAQAASNCSIASNCKHLFHLNQGNNAIDVTIHYDVKSAQDSGYKDIGCGSVDIKTNPSNSLDAIRLYVESDPGTFTTIGTSTPCVLGGTAATHNDVAANGTYTYLGSRPYQSFRDASGPRLKVVTWGLDYAGSSSVSQTWTLP